jgi:Asp-tRNA(Asn)/Glu-tRNA(Gln) amidotransferase A subunit family amidase
MAVFDLLTTNAIDLQSLLSSGQLSSVNLVEGYLSQVESHNERGLGLRAIATLSPKDDSLRRARELDYERRCGRVRGPLHGIPIVVKVCLFKSSGIEFQFAGRAVSLVKEFYRTASSLGRSSRQWQARWHLKARNLLEVQR